LSYNYFNTLAIPSCSTGIRHYIFDFRWKKLQSHEGLYSLLKQYRTLNQLFALVSTFIMAMTDCFYKRKQLSIKVRKFNTRAVFSTNFDIWIDYHGLYLGHIQSSPLVRNPLVRNFRLKETPIFTKELVHYTFIRNSSYKGQIFMVRMSSF